MTSVAIGESAGYRTPTVATLVMGTASALSFVLLTAVSQNVLADSAASVGLLIAFYYGLTGLACVWFFRRDLLTSPEGIAAPADGEGSTAI
jgi:hypothetical protein